MKRLLALIFACSLSALAGDVAGKWNFTAKDPDDYTIKAELLLAQKDGRWTGSLNGEAGSIPLRDVSFNGTVLKFTVDYSDTEVSVKMNLDGNAMKGSYDAAAGPSGPVEATRTVAAQQGAAGVWNLKTIGPDGDNTTLRLTLKQDGTRWSGEMISDSYDVEMTLENVKVDSGLVSFRVPTQVGVYAVTAKADGNTFEGTAIAPDGASNPISGTR